tara:strand:+ start:22129 stop:23571 length:1443 start_codon:yes stop_codon:yes gene_type:complete
MVDKQKFGKLKSFAGLSFTKEKSDNDDITRNNQRIAFSLRDIQTTLQAFIDNGENSRKLLQLLKNDVNGDSEVNMQLQELLRHIVDKIVPVAHDSLSIFNNNARNQRTITTLVDSVANLNGEINQYILLSAQFNQKFSTKEVDNLFNRVCESESQARAYRGYMQQPPSSAARLGLVLDEFKKNLDRDQDKRGNEIARYTSETRKDMSKKVLQVGAKVKTNRLQAEASDIRAPGEIHRFPLNASYRSGAKYHLRSLDLSKSTLIVNEQKHWGSATDFVYRARLSRERLFTIKLKEDRFSIVNHKKLNDNDLIDQLGILIDLLTAISCSGSFNPSRRMGMPSRHNQNYNEIIGYLKNNKQPEPTENMIYLNDFIDFSDSSSSSSSADADENINLIAELTEHKSKALETKKATEEKRQQFTRDLSLFVSKAAINNGGRLGLGKTNNLSKLSFRDNRSKQQRIKLVGLVKEDQPRNASKIKSIR